jgi:hypothetical protein
MYLNDERDEQVRHSLFVFNPIVAILFVAHVIVSDRPVDEEDQEVDRLEVWNRRVKSAEQAPRQCHQPIACVGSSSIGVGWMGKMSTCVINFSGTSPPAARDQLGPAFGLQEREMSNLIGAE